MGFVNGPDPYLYCGNNPINCIDPLGLYWGEDQINWWLYQSVVPGPYGQPVSEWGLNGPTGWGDLIGEADMFGGNWGGKERIAVGASALAIGGAIGYDWALPYWRYVGPNSLEDSPWVVRGWEPPYGNDYNLAQDQLQLPNTPTDVVPVQNNPWNPVAGPRPVSGNSQWGNGGGQERYKGPWFPKNS